MPICHNRRPLWRRVDRLMDFVRCMNPHPTRHRRCRMVCGRRRRRHGALRTPRAALLLLRRCALIQRRQPEPPSHPAAPAAPIGDAGDADVRRTPLGLASRWPQAMRLPAPAEALLHAASHSEVLVLCQPITPAANASRPEVLLALRGGCERGGWLLVDETALLTPPRGQRDPVRYAHPNLIVLRSLGQILWPGRAAPGHGGHTRPSWPRWTPRWAMDDQRRRPTHRPRRAGLTPTGSPPPANACRKTAPPGGAAG